MSCLLSLLTDNKPTNSSFSGPLRSRCLHLGHHVGIASLVFGLLDGIDHLARLDNDLLGNGLQAKACQCFAKELALGTARFICASILNTRPPLDTSNMTGTKLVD